jgi:hypothetical protein
MRKMARIAAAIAVVFVFCSPVTAQFTMPGERAKQRPVGIKNGQLTPTTAGTVLCNPINTFFPGMQGCWTNSTNSVEGTGVNGFDGNQFFIWYAPSSTAGSGNPAAFRVDRRPSFTGGTPGTTQNAMWGYIVVPSGDTFYEWAILGQVDNSATAGQNVGIYALGNAMTSGAGPTWGGVSQITDRSSAANPTVGRVGLEVDNSANGTDTNSNRVLIDAVVQNFNSGTAPTVTYGLRVSPATFTITNGLYFNNGTFTNFINSNSGTFSVAGTGKITSGSGSLSGVGLSLQNSVGTCTFTATNSGASTQSCTSDERTKTAIRNAASEMAWLESFRIRDYTSRTNGEAGTGIVAQEVMPVHPEMVSEVEGGMYAVQQPSPWKMMKVLQELKTANDSLNACMDSWKCRLFGWR